jgi:hypothetical protein
MDNGQNSVLFIGDGIILKKWPLMPENLLDIELRLLSLKSIKKSLFHSEVGKGAYGASRLSG